jgi:hypothetical protein
MDPMGFLCRWGKLWFHYDSKRAHLTLTSFTCTDIAPFKLAANWQPNSEHQLAFHIEWPVQQVRLPGLLPGGSRLKTNNHRRHDIECIREYHGRQFGEYRFLKIMAICSLIQAFGVPLLS